MRIMDNFTREELQEIVQKSNSYKECLRIIGYKGISGDTLKAFRLKLNDLSIDTSHFNQEITLAVPKKYSNDIIFLENSTVSQKCLRRHYEELYPQNQCSICNLLPIWNNQKLSLILDHINGNNHDNRIENLRWVCPNCNSQLPTTGSRNYKK